MYSECILNEFWMYSDCILIVGVVAGSGFARLGHRASPRKPRRNRMLREVVLTSFSCWAACWICLVVQFTVTHITIWCPELQTVRAFFFLAPQRQGATRQHFSWEPRLEKCQGRLASGWGSALCLPRLTGKRTCPVAVQYLSKPAFRISFRSFGSCRHWGR